MISIRSRRVLIEIELLYKNKCKNLTSHAQRNSGSDNIRRNTYSPTRIKDLNIRIDKLEATNNSLDARIK